MEKRRKEAMEYLVKKYHESKKREEELKRKLESYSRVRLWMYERSMNLKDACMMFKELVVKPVGITIAVLSGFPSLILAASISPKITQLIDNAFPFPYNEVINIFVCFPIGFALPMIAEVSYAYYVNKEAKKRLKEDYGIEI